MSDRFALVVDDVPTPRGHLANARASFVAIMIHLESARKSVHASGADVATIAGFEAYARVVQEWLVTEMAMLAREAS